jgi:NitT/TauT family transport system permease protein
LRALDRARIGPLSWKSFPGISRGRLLLAVAWVGSIVLVWELLVAGLSIRPYLLPAPTEILAAGTDDIDVLIRHGSITLYETLLGFGLAAVVGIALATVMFYSERLSFVLLPTLAAANAAPKIAFAPILIIWLGLGFESKIVMSFLLSFFPIVINTSRGLAGVPQELVDLFKLLQASRAQAFRKVRIPFAYPAMFDGFKIALPLALIGSIVMEFFGGTAGIGYQMTLAYANFNTPFVFAAVVAVALLAMIMFQILAAIERIVLRGRPQSSH